MCEQPKRKARMPWHGDIAHTRLPDGRVVLRGSEEEALAFLGPVGYTQVNSLKDRRV